LSNYLAYRILVGTFAVLCLAFSLFQTFQIERYLIHYVRMSKQHYWYIFGKIDSADYTDIHLEIDRGNPNWVERKEEYQNHGYKLDTHVIFDKPEVQTAAPFTDLRHDKFTLLELIPN